MKLHPLFSFPFRALEWGKQLWPNIISSMLPCLARQAREACCPKGAVELDQSTAIASVMIKLAKDWRLEHPNDLRSAESRTCKLACFQPFKALVLNTTVCQLSASPPCGCCCALRSCHQGDHWGSGPLLLRLSLVFSLRNLRYLALCAQFGVKNFLSLP